MNDEKYRFRLKAVTVIASSAFAGANLFIGLSMGVFWLSLAPLEFVNDFGPQFQRFLLTIMPLFLVTLAGLILSLRMDWDRSELRRNWLYALCAFVALSLITLGFHVPENLRLLSAAYSAENADAARNYWLLGHIPRVILAFCVPWFAFRSIMARA